METLARTLTGAGISVVPIVPDGSKAPAIKWKRYQTEIADAETIHGWYSNGSGYGIAAVCGSVSGNLEDLDIDAPDLATPWRNLVEQHEGGADLLRRLVIVQTPSGGYAVTYRCEAPVDGNLKLARRPGDHSKGESAVEVLFETRGQAGYFLLRGCPVECHPSGKPYTLAQGDLTAIPTITVEEREILLSCAKAFDRMPRRDFKEGAANVDGDRPGDTFNRTATWEDVLGPHQWHRLHAHSGVTYWRRPGKGIGVSATTNWDGRDRLKVFSTSTVFESDSTYSKFAAYAVLNHGGDFRAAAREIGASEYIHPTVVDDSDAAERAAIQAVEREAEEALPYTSPCAPDHFISKWIDYGIARTDASPEYHEAAALVLLASATPGVRVKLAQYPQGLPTNLYCLVIGDSTTSRKSTATGFARDIHGDALRDGICADAFSPEGFIEQLAARGRDSMTLYVDEFSELLTKLAHSQYMAGLRGNLLTMYDGRDYTARRHTKNNRGTKVEDSDHVERPHFSILGATTPGIFDNLVEGDVISGLLPRFAVVMPSGKLPRRPFFVTPPDLEAQRADFVQWVCRIHEWAAGDTHAVLFDVGVMERLDSFAQEIETVCGKVTTSTVEKTMLARLLPMAVKVAVLIAAGQPGVADGPTTLRVTMDDAGGAIEIARRWQGYAVDFASRIGESAFEKVLARCLKVIRQKATVRRGIVAQIAHVDAKTLDAVRDTLADRDLITVIRPQTGGRSGELWLAGGH